MRVVSLNQMVTAQYYDEEFSEWNVRSRPIVDVLWDTIEENVDEISFEAEPVKHGDWQTIEDYNVRKYVCSECGAHHWHQYNYCPDCGTRLKRTDES